ncbi:MAG: nitroreductase, partial [Candidatus Thorarchaeota archaeon]
MKDYLDFLKADWWKEIDWKQTESGKKIPFPKLEKEYPQDAKLINLIPMEEFKVKEISILEAIKQRESHRTYDDKPLTLAELSFLLWSTQGIHKIVWEGRATKR